MRCRFFKSTKLDYPSKDTNKASRAYVKAMKRLTVRFPSRSRTTPLPHHSFRPCPFPRYFG